MSLSYCVCILTGEVERYNSSYGYLVNQPGTSFGVNTSRRNHALFSSQWPLDMHTIPINHTDSQANIDHLSLIQGFEVERCT